jgi:hypothetical protein
LLWLGIPILYSIKTRENDTLVSFLTLEEVISVFPYLDDIYYTFIIYILYYTPSIPSFFRAFIMKKCRMLSKAFFSSVEMIMWFLS